MQAKLAHKGLMLISLPLAWGTVCILVLFLLVQKSEQEADQQVAAAAFLNQLLNFNRCISQAEILCFQLSDDYANQSDLPHSTLSRAKDVGATKTPPPIQIDQSVKNLSIANQSLRSNVGKVSAAAATIDFESAICNKLIGLLDEAKNSLRFADPELISAKMDSTAREVHSLAEESSAKLDKAIVDENASLALHHSTEEKYSAFIKNGLIAAIFSELIVCMIVGWVYAKSIVKRIDILVANAIRFGVADSLLAPLPGDDEIAQFDHLFHGVARDLTEARRKEKLLVEKSADVIFNIDEAGVVQNVNEACESVWQRSQSDVLGKPFIDMVFEADRDMVQSILSEKASTAFDCRLGLHESPTVCKISFSWAPTEQMYFCTAHDIAIRKLEEETLEASEKHLRNTLNSMMVAVVVTSLDGVIESMNKSAENIFGCSEKDLVGRHCVCLFGDAKFFSEANEADVKTFQTSLYQKSFNRISETECLRRDGQLFVVELLMNQIETAQGGRYTLGILDVSGLREAEKSRKEFVSTVSHELRTPLTSIRGSLTLLTAGAMGEIPDAIRKMIVVAERNVLRLIGLINDILDIEKLESGKLEMVFEDVAMSSVLERSVDAVKSFAEQHNVVLDIQPSDAVVNADGDRLIQVLVNLMSNACKFSPKGAAVTVSVTKEDDWLSVKVIDRGRGIPEKFKKLLFQRFQQVEAADAKKKGGTGLGLAICKGLIEAHGGTIGVESEEGKGSTFWYRIPMSQAQRASAELVSAAEGS